MKRYFTYKFAGNHKHEDTVITAEFENDARQLCMIERYGILPDDIVPYAPDYAGRGLLLKSVKPATN